MHIWKLWGYFIHAQSFCMLWYEWQLNLSSLFLRTKTFSCNSNTSFVIWHYFRWNNSSAIQSCEMARKINVSGDSKEQYSSILMCPGFLSFSLLLFCFCCFCLGFWVFSSLILIPPFKVYLTTAFISCCSCYRLTLLFYQGTFVFRKKVILIQDLSYPRANRKENISRG